MNYNGVGLSMTGHEAPTKVNKLIIKGTLPLPKRTTSNNFSGSSYLFLNGGNFRCLSMGMSIQSLPVPNFYRTVDILISGSTLKGGFSAVPLTIFGLNRGTAMNLFIKGKDSGGKSKTMKLVVVAGVPNNSGTIPLFINNQAENISDNLRLNIAGDGILSGYIPKINKLGLYIEKGPVSGTTLFLCSKWSTNQTSLHITGAPKISSNVPFIIRGFGDKLTNNSTLSIVGNVFESVISSRTLVIPKVVGFIPESAQLYMNGFQY